YEPHGGAAGERFYRREIENMRLLSAHPYIVRLLRVLETRDELTLVLELHERGTLEDYVRASEHGRLREHEAGRFFAQLVSALAHCHACGVVHRDLKAQNVVLADDARSVRLIDFGLSTRHGGDEDAPLRTYCGSPLYLAPEVLCRHEYD